jgi:hypothetical protein
MKVPSTLRIIISVIVESVPVKHTQTKTHKKEDKHCIDISGVEWGWREEWEGGGFMMKKEHENDEARRRQ